MESLEGRSPWTASVRFSRTVRVGNVRVIWYVRPIPRPALRAAAIRVTSRPKRAMRPPVAASSPLMTLNRVVFPAPLGPMIPCRAPGATESVTPATASTPPKRRSTPVRVRAGSAGASLTAFRRHVTEVLHLRSRGGGRTGAGPLGHHAEQAQHRPPQPGPGEEHHEHEQDPEDGDPALDVDAHELLEQDNDDRPATRPPQRPQPAASAHLADRDV